MSHKVPLDALLLVVRDGDERGWDAEFDRLWSEQQGQMDMLTTSIQETGIRLPILIGSDGRVWDGHHRLAAAHRLGMAEVPIQWSAEDDDPTSSNTYSSGPESDTSPGHVNGPNTSSSTSKGDDRD